MSRGTILICEDDKQFLQIIAHILEKEGYQTIQTVFGEEALKWLQESVPDLIILDLNLPDMDGLDVCKKIRNNDTTKSIPIIMCTVKSTELDTVIGFEMGADDYITKPIIPTILLARVKAVMRRGSQQEDSPPILFTFGSLTLDIETRECRVDEMLISMTPKEFDLLHFFMKHPGKALTRNFLTESVWGYEYFGSSHTLDTVIYNLRKKLGKEGKRIETIQSIGFRFTAA